MASSDKQLQPTTDFTAAEIAAVLAKHGAVDEQVDYFKRMKIDGTNFVASDGEIWVSDPRTKAPAFTARIVAPPEQYQSFWFTEAYATEASRPEMANRFCRSHYNNPAENREYGTNGASCRSCIFNPFGDAPQKCSWKGDLHIQPIPDDGVMKGDEETYTLTLTVTGMIEWRGSKTSGNGGSVTDKHFMYKLAELALTLAPEWGISNEEAITAALTSLNAGYVAAEFRAVRTTNEKNNNTWSVPVITPVHIELLPEDPLLEAGDIPSA